MKHELSNKKTISVFAPSKDCPLTYPDLLVYCHRADQFRFGTVPPCRRVAKATGLQEGTVSASGKRLQDHGLLTPESEVVDPCPRLGWFLPLDALKERCPEGPAFQWLQNWKALVRRPGENVLTVPSVLVYSVIRHSVEQKWKPAHGWTHEYLALLTATNPKTVTNALAVLEEHGFFKVLDGMRFQLFRLRDAQAACFADKNTWSGNSSEPDEFIHDFGPGSDRLENRHAARLALDEYLNRFPVTEKGRAQGNRILIVGLDLKCLREESRVPGGS